jgi:hypothetical protein
VQGRTGQDAAMPRLRNAAILMVCAVLAVGLGALALADPFHLRHARWYTVGAVLLAIVLVTAAFAAVVRRGLLRGFVLVVGGVAVLTWLALAWLVAQLDVQSQEVLEVADGDRRLVVLERYPVIDPVYAVVVRAGVGPIEQETVVYQGPEDGPQPSVRFVDFDTVEVTVAQACTYRSEIEPITLAVDRVHRPLRLGTC